MAQRKANRQRTRKRPAEAVGNGYSRQIGKCRRSLSNDAKSRVVTASARFERFATQKVEHGPQKRGARVKRRGDCRARPPATRERATARRSAKDAATRSARHAYSRVGPRNASSRFAKWRERHSGRYRRGVAVMPDSNGHLPPARSRAWQRARRCLAWHRHAWLRHAWLRHAWRRHGQASRILAPYRRRGRPGSTPGGATQTAPPSPERSEKDFALRASLQQPDASCAEVFHRIGAHRLRISSIQ